MSELAQWSLTGTGNIGGEIVRQLGQPQVSERLGLQPKPLYVVNSRGTWNHDLETPSKFHNLDEIDDSVYPAVHFIALPSTNDGIVATEHISRVLQRGKVAVTAEKGSVANNFAELRQASEGFQKLGIDATVGGGTRLMEAMRLYTLEDPANVSQIHLALNGTMSFIMSEIGPRGEGAGISHGEAVKQAVTLGYAEPGSQSFNDVVKSEAEGDIPKKTAILFNHLGLGGAELLDWKSLRVELSGTHLKRIVREARVRRFIVSLYAQKFHETVKPDEEDIIGGFNVDCGGFQIVGGFQNVEYGSAFRALGEITGPGNGALVGLGPNEDDGFYRVGFGPGAGVGPTVNTMLDNWSRIRREQARVA